MVGLGGDAAMVAELRRGSEGKDITDGMEEVFPEGCYEEAIQPAAPIAPVNWRGRTLRNTHGNLIFPH